MPTTSHHGRRLLLLLLLLGALSPNLTQARDETGWVPCAREGQTCHVPGPAQVRFGANGYFATRTVDGAIDCGTREFGDPVRRLPKTCEYQLLPERDRPHPDRDGRDDREDRERGWVDCAKEGEVCRFHGQRLVRFGADGAYNVRRVTDQIDCSSEQFGDPVHGVRKRCQVRGEPDPGGPDPFPGSGPGPHGDGHWVRCADEGQTCNTPMPAVVRFGVPGDYHYRQVSGPVRCDGRAFGDPRPGVMKSCEFAVAPGHRPLDRPDPQDVPPLDDRFWRPCARESQICSFRGEAPVRFGANGVYRVLYARDSVRCDVRSFGGDPTPNTRKQCAVFRP